MVRTQIQLTEEQAEALKSLAAEQRVSVAELIRQSVDQLIQSTENLSRTERRKRAMSVVGMFHSGQHDISSRHDDYLAESYLS
jgi:hypothetical protein